MLLYQKHLSRRQVKKCKPINFNYQYFLFDLDEELPEVEIPLFTHPQLTLKCEVIQTITREDGTYYLYEIKNAQDIPLDIWHQEVSDWLS